MRGAVWLVAVVGAQMPWSTARLEGQSTTAEPLLRGRIELLRAGGEATAAGDPLLARRALPAFYDERAFEPAWLDAAGLLRVDSLLSAVAQAARHGLEPAAYHLEALTRLREAAGAGTASTAELVDLELLASDGFMLLGSHLLQGRVNPETIDPEWLANRREATLETVLVQALEGRGIAASLASMAPQQPRYRRMVDARERLLELARDGGWPTILPGERLEAGLEDPRVQALRARLRASGDLEGSAPDGPVFDDALADAVRRFQARHGLDVDGVVGPATLTALNVTAADRARQIEINLERWRWLPADLGARHIEVNIAAFDVKVVERGRVVRSHRAVVGRQYRQTPMFSGVMTYVVLSPYWHVPPTIAAVDKLPVIRQDPGFIGSQHMTLLDQRTNQSVDPGTVDWGAMTGAEFNRRYRLRQDPGPDNALGAVKFMFPNRHNVYLHDTPSRELFGRASRSFSSGCIRVQDPLDLAAYLLADQPNWTRERIDKAVATRVEHTVPLSQGLPVHLLYWTAWADEGGVLHFRDDIYGRDGAVRHALEMSPPGA